MWTLSCSQHLGATPRPAPCWGHGQGRDTMEAAGAGGQRGRPGEG